MSSWQKQHDKSSTTSSAHADRATRRRLVVYNRPDIAISTRSSAGGCQGVIVDEQGWVGCPVRVYIRVIIRAIVAVFIMVNLWKLFFEVFYLSFLWFCQFRCPHENTTKTYRRAINLLFSPMFLLLSPVKRKIENRPPPCDESNVRSGRNSLHPIDINTKITSVSLWAVGE